MGEGRAHTNRRPAQIVEPTDDEKAAVKAARTFWRVFSKDSTALGVLAFALFFFIVFAIVIVTLVGGIASGEYGQQDIRGLPLSAPPCSSYSPCLWSRRFLSLVTITCTRTR